MKIFVRPLEFLRKLALRLMRTHKNEENPSDPTDPSDVLPDELDPAIALLCEELLRKGRFHPAWEELGIRIFLTLLKEAAPIAFREGEKAIPPLHWFRHFLELLPPLISFDEAAPDSSPSKHLSHGVVKPAAGIPLDNRSVSLHRRALQMQAEDNALNYTEALRRAAQ